MGRFEASLDTEMIGQKKSIDWAVEDDIGCEYLQGWGVGCVRECINVRGGGGWHRVSWTVTTAATTVSSSRVGRGCSIEEEVDPN